MRNSKKAIVAVVVSLVLLLVISPYIFIPSDLTISNYEKIIASPAAISRTINTGKHLAAFSAHTDSSFTQNGYTYRVTKRLYNASDIEIKHGENVYHSSITIIPMANDTSMVNWGIKGEVASGNPISRMIAYNKAVALKENMEAVLQQLKPFLEDSKKVYGFAIARTTLTDTDLISMKKTFTTYPGVKEIYSMVDELKAYIATSNAAVANHPMLNVTHMDGAFQAMVAIPVNKVLPGNGTVEPKHLIPIKNKILTTEIQGGVATIKEAYKQLEQYMADHSLSAPVIPFEQMVTDRSKEADTTKWVTKIFYPII